VFSGTARATRARVCSTLQVTLAQALTGLVLDLQGNRTTPSYVAFTETERLIGDAAKNQTAMNSTNTVFDAKRLIGRKFSDPIVQADMKLWPFKVARGPGDKPLIEVRGGWAVAAFLWVEVRVRACA
jgi:molecular chaperone DnaK (HSP70)